MIKRLYFILLIFIFCGSKLLAQAPPAWGGGADVDDVSFGFHFDYISSSYKILKQADWRKPYYNSETGKYLTDSLNSITSAGTPGFAVGFIMRYRITDHLEVRTTPSLVFADRTITYKYATPSQNIDKSVHASQVEVPLLLKLKSDRIGNFRAYLLGGVKYSYGLSTDKTNEDPNLSPLEKQVINNRGYASYEAGIGCDIYFEYFKFSPEVKISNSFGSVLTPGTDPYSQPLQKLLLRSLVFTIYFE
ncbi:outer membrane beta-barrel protein [Mucilaginibacter sp. AW1-3]